MSKIEVGKVYWINEVEAIQLIDDRHFLSISFENYRKVLDEDEFFTVTLYKGKFQKYKNNYLFRGTANDFINMDFSIFKNYQEKKYADKHGPFKTRKVMDFTLFKNKGKYYVLKNMVKKPLREADKPILGLTHKQWPRDPKKFLKQFHREDDGIIDLSWRQLSNVA